MRNNTFLNLRVMLRNELGRSTNVAVGVDDVERLNNALNFAYEQNYSAADWPFLRKTFTAILLNAGQRYYDFPSALNFDKVEGVWAWWGGRPQKVTRGIGFQQYLAYDSINDQRADPPMRWDVRYVGEAITTNNTQFEIWPLPASTGTPIVFIGLRKYVKLVADADVCPLDDWLVVKYAAASLEKDPKRTQLRRQEYGERLTEITADMNSGRQPIRPNGEGVPPEELFKNVTIVVGS